MSRQRKLDSDLRAMVEAGLLPTERIWDVDIEDDGIVTVLVIADAAIQQANRMNKIGLAGGEGRSLSFERTTGTWSLKAISRWIA